MASLKQIKMEHSKNIRVDDDLNAYKGFFDYEWSKVIEEAARGTCLSPLVFDLAVSWKGISDARRLPWLMMEAIKAALEGFVNLTPPIPGQALGRLIDKIDHGLEKHNLSLSGKDRKTLVQEIRAVEAEIRRAASSHRVSFSTQDLWSHFLQSQGIALSLLMSEVNAYSGLYFGYESYLINSAKTVKSLPRLRARGLPDQLEALGGKTLADACWNDRAIEIARLVRYAITHNGRKITNDLQKYRADLVLESDEIVIMAQQTTELYNLLKHRVLLFTCEIVKRPEAR